MCHCSAPDRLLAQAVRAIEGLKKLTTNPAVIGAHAEAAVRRLVRRIVHPLRVSTGAVISEELCEEPSSIPQLDTIIWQPCPAPALLEVGDFGVVARGSSMAIMEIKRSAYSKVGKQLKAQLNQDLVRKLVADNPPGWVRSDQPELYPDYPALGVVCLRETQVKDADLENLIARGHCVVILEMQPDGVKPNVEAVYRLINFLIRARQRALAWDGKALVNMTAVTSKT